MAKSSDVGAVRVPDRLTDVEILELRHARVGPLKFATIDKAHDRLAFLESLVQDVANQTIDTSPSGEQQLCRLCQSFAFPAGQHPANYCPYPRLLAAVSDDREDEKGHGDMATENNAVYGWRYSTGQTPGEWLVWTPDRIVAARCSRMDCAKRLTDAMNDAAKAADFPAPPTRTEEPEKAGLSVQDKAERYDLMRDLEKSTLPCGHRNQFTYSLDNWKHIYCAMCGVEERDRLREQIETMRTGTITADTSDGYHTFRELYEYRKLYNAALFNEWYRLGLYGVHKSRKHSDGEACFGGGWFIVVAQLPTGQISNHYKDVDWDLFNITEREVAEPWDGHTPQIVAERLTRFLFPPERP